jgi:hypothetical protein
MMKERPVQTAVCEKATRVYLARETRVDRLNLQIRQDEIKGVARGAIRVQ